MSTRKPNRPGRHRAASVHRTLHLLDMENLVGPQLTQDACADLWSRYQSVVTVDRDDQAFIAAASGHVIEAMRAIDRNVCWLAPMAAPDAADRALVESSPADWVARRFTRVIIGSGDHYFARHARDLRLRGMVVEQATGLGFCSAELYRACRHHYDLRPPSTPACAA